MGVTADIKIDIPSKYLIFIACLILTSMLLFSPMSPLNVFRENIMYLRPCGVGSNTGLSGDWSSVSGEPLAIGATSSFVHANRSGLLCYDTYETTDLTENVKIKSVTITARVMGYGVAKTVLRTYDKDFFGVEEAVSSNTWQNVSFTWSFNPVTGESWTMEEVNDMEIGIALRSITGDLYCCQVYAEVEF